MTDSVKGPMGLWPFPILNMLMSMLGGRQGGSGMLRQGGVVSSFANTEEWKIVKGPDGGIASIIVHRKARRE